MMHTCTTLDSLKQLKGHQVSNKHGHNMCSLRLYGNQQHPITRGCGLPQREGETVQCNQSPSLLHACAVQDGCSLWPRCRTLSLLHQA